jgi:DNA repair exonuclease SbcCD ATPase subunit
MQSATARVPTRRQRRAACPRCGRPLEIHRMREHLREGHQLESRELEFVLLQARRDAIRGISSPRP